MKCSQISVRLPCRVPNIKVQKVSMACNITWLGCVYSNRTLKFVFQVFLMYIRRKLFQARCLLSCFDRELMRISNFCANVALLVGMQQSGLKNMQNVVQGCMQPVALVSSRSRLQMHALQTENQRIQFLEPISLKLVVPALETLDTYCFEHSRTQADVVAWYETNKICQWT